MWPLRRKSHTPKTIHRCQLLQPIMFKPRVPPVCRMVNHGWLFALSLTLVFSYWLFMNCNILWNVSCRREYIYSRMGALLFSLFGLFHSRVKCIPHHHLSQLAILLLKCLFTTLLNLEKAQLRCLDVFLCESLLWGESQTETEVNNLGSVWPLFCLNQVKHELLFSLMLMWRSGLKNEVLT